MASKLIKGITVEIGGDSTKLGKALDNVDKKAKDLNTELKGINTLLKMDPSNTELLAQKQKVLAEAVANTSEKLAKLKEAEKQVQKQFEKGEVSEAQVRDLQREIIATENALRRYGKEAEETAKAIEDVGDSSKEVSKGAKEVDKGADKAADSLDDLSDSAKNAEKSSDGLGVKLASVAKNGLLAVAAAAAAAISGLVGAAESTREYRTAMGKLETAFTQNGHTAESATRAYQALQSVLGDTDQAVEAANHLAKLTDNEKDLAIWSERIMPGVFATFGDSLPIEGLTEAANETAKVGQVTGALADALNWAGVSEDEFNESLKKANSEQERQKLIQQELVKLYGDASEAYQDANAEVIRANQANEQWMASMAGLGGVTEPIITDVKMMGASLLSDLVPGVEQLATAFRALFEGDMGGAEGIGEALSGIITALLDKIISIVPAVGQAAVSLVSTLVTTILSMLPQVLSTAVQLVMTLLDGLTVALPQVIKAVADVIPKLVEALVAGIPQLLQGAVQLILAILDAIPQVLPPLVEAIPQIVMALVDGLLTAIPQLLDGALTFLLAIVDAIPMLVAKLVPEIPKILVAIYEGLLDALPQLLEVAYTLLSAIVEAIPLIVVELIKALPQIWETMKSFFTQLPSKLWAILASLVQNWVKCMSECYQTVLEGAQKIVNTLINTLRTMPGKVFSIGADLIAGLWNGINGKIEWLKSKISSFASSVLDSIKDFFGVHSPSTETAWIGDMLDQGLAEGMVDNMRDPVKAAQRVAGNTLDAMDGLALERGLQSRAVTLQAAAPNNIGLVEKLDKILSAIERGQVIALDGKQLVGATADRMDNVLGQRRVLAARGAL